MSDETLQDDDIIKELLKPVIPKQDTAYSETIHLPIKNAAPIDVTFEYPDKPQEDYAIKMWDKINSFEKKAWSPQNKGLKTGFKNIDNAFEQGIVPAFYIVAGDSNLGKTGFVSQMAYQMAQLNSDIFVMDFSLDDPLQDKLSRVIACDSKIIINSVKSPNNYKHLPTMLVRRTNGILKLRKLVDRYVAYDSTFTTYVQEIEDEIKRMKILFDSLGVKKKLCVFIDNFHDLNIKGKDSWTDKQKYEYLASWCAGIAIKYDIPLICTAEIKKANTSTFRRPILDDIREAGKIKFQAKAIMLVYNEVHYKGENTQVYYTRSNNPLKQPVFEVHVAKNKVSSYKGRLFFEFMPDISYFQESSEQATKHYASLIYNS